MRNNDVPGAGPPDSAPATQDRVRRRVPTRIVFGSALVCGAGLIIAWIDSRPTWDDTGITAGALTIAAAWGAFVGLPPLLGAALAAGPILAAELPRGLGVLLAVPFALAGAYIGAFVRRRSAGHPA